MFEKLLRELRQLESGVTLSLPVQCDDDGYFDRLCPWDECGYPFKVLYEDWVARVSDSAAYCPFCRHEAEAADFRTPEQAEYVKRAGLAEVQKRFNRGLSASARDFNRKAPRGLLTMRLEVSSPPVTVALPPVAEEAMTMRMQCDDCGCRFAVVGAGYFCPACGENSAETTFDQSIAAARRTTELIISGRIAIEDRDERARAEKDWTEQTLTGLVTAFERFAEASYPKLPTPQTAASRNAFQNLGYASDLWSKAGGTAFGGILSEAELADLNRLFQQRHVLVHRDGMVDQRYIDQSSDPRYRVGQRLVVRPMSVVTMAGFLEKLVSGLRQDLV